MSSREPTEASADLSTIENAKSFIRETGLVNLNTLTREAAEAMATNSGCAILRESRSQPGKIAVTVYDTTEGKCKHHILDDQIKISTPSFTDKASTIINIESLFHKPLPSVTKCKDMIIKTGLVQPSTLNRADAESLANSTLSVVIRHSSTSAGAIVFTLPDPHGTMSAKERNIVFDGPNINPNDWLTPENICKSVERFFHNKPYQQDPSAGLDPTESYRDAIRGITTAGTDPTTDPTGPENP